MALRFDIMGSYHEIFQTGQFSLKTSSKLVSYEFFEMSVTICITREIPKKFISLFQKKLKIIPYYVDFYEHGKL